METWSFSSSSSSPFSLNLIIISKVSNPLRNRSDYETAQEGIVREVGTFCRCKHPSLVRYLFCHRFIKVLSVSIPVPVSVPVPVPGANTPVLSGTCASLSHFYQDTFYTNTCTCICFCTWWKHPSLAIYLRFLYLRLLFHLWGTAGWSPTSPGRTSGFSFCQVAFVLFFTTLNKQLLLKVLRGGDPVSIKLLTVSHHLFWINNNY